MNYRQIKTLINGLFLIYLILVMISNFNGWNIAVLNTDLLPLMVIFLLCGGELLDKKIRNADEQNEENA